MSIKKVFSYIFTLSFVLFSAEQTQSQSLIKTTSSSSHYMTVSGAFGYANLLQDVPYTSSDGGVGALLGFSYERHHGKFLYSLGAEFDYKVVNISREDFTATVGMIDTEGDDLDFNYNFSDFSDNYQIAYVNIPLMLGYTNDKVYFMAGAKFGLNVFNLYKIKSHLNTTGVYPWASEIFHDMPDHYFTDLDLENNGSFSLDYSIVTSAELGFYLPQGSKENLRFRLGLFADYGVKTVRIDEPYQSGEVDGNVFSLPTKYGSNVLDVTLNPLVTADAVSYQHSFNPMLVGIKLTALFELPMNQECKCLQTSRRDNYRSSISKMKRKNKRQ